MAGLARAENPEPLRIGDAAPALTGIEWLTGPIPEPLHRPGKITVLEFWASWCPASRFVLAHQESLAAAWHRDGIELVAVSQESAHDLRAFLKRAGWRDLALGCDPARTALADFFDRLTALETRERVFPFAVVIGEEPACGPGTILWAGPVVAPQDPAPLAAFEGLLQEIRAGRYDLAAAVRLARDEEHSLETIQDLRAARGANDLERIGALLDELSAATLAPSIENGLVGQMNDLAWTFATDEARTPRHLALARQAVEIALAAGGAENAYFVDTQARVAFECRELEKACEIQRRAVELVRGTPDYAGFAETLRGYLREADLPTDDPLLRAEVEPGSGSAGGEVWSGTLNEASDFDPASGLLLVRPAAFADTAREGSWQRSIAALREHFYAQSQLRQPNALTAAERGEHSLLLYGTPAANPLTAEVLVRSGITLEEEGVRVGERFLPARRPILIVALPNPWNPTLPARVYTALHEEDALGLNRFFHGPTALLVGQWEEGRPAVRYTLDFAPAPPGADPCTRPLAIAAESLSREEAVADLRQLHDLLHDRYAGYADLDWDLRCRGSSWSERTDAYAARLAERSRWAWGEYFALLREYLEPVEDTHFMIAGTGIVEGDVETLQARLIRQRAAYFTDLRVVRDGETFRLAAAPPEIPSRLGTALGEIPLIPTTRTAREGIAYLFPTLPSSAAPAGATVGEEYLLGTLADAADPPAFLRISLPREPWRPWDDPQGSADLRLPLHRGRVARVRHGEPWSIMLPPEAPLPTLRVQTMVAQRLGEMPACADSLRHHPRLLLDLRGNSGGSDMPAMQWCQRLSGQPYRWIAGVSPRGFGPDPLQRSVSFVGARREQVAGPGVPAAPDPYAGQLLVLIDKGVASSGETFTMLAGQIPGAVLVGENTSGCVSYGNIRVSGPLAHSGIELRFGRTKFVEDWVRPNREGFGFFPDYWIDDEDPARLLADWGTPAAVE